nr:hypothetical protein [Tanacetum cinerariifolium]
CLYEWDQWKPWNLGSKFRSMNVCKGEYGKALMASNGRTTASQVIERKKFSVLCTIEMYGYDDVDDGGDNEDCDLMRTDILLSENIMGFIAD